MGNIYQKKGDHAIYPVIGIPYQANYHLRSAWSPSRKNRPYVQAVESAGGQPVLLPTSTHPSALEHLLPRLDGLLFTGGSDIQPSLYGEQAHPFLNAVDPQLDAFEMALATWALQRDLPILGICRGMQLINVVLGGTLYQDISAQHPGSLQHWWCHLPRTELAHHVMVEKGSLMELTLRTRQLAVNSLHHQAVKDPGTGIRICGWADDGIAELLEVPRYRFVLGIQSHPEEIYREVPALARLFQAFIHSCYRPSTEPIASFQPIEAFQSLQLQSASARSLSSFPISGKELKPLKAA